MSRHALLLGPGAFGGAHGTLGGRTSEQGVLFEGWITGPLWQKGRKDETCHGEMETPSAPGHYTLSS